MKTMIFILINLFVANAMADSGIAKARSVANGFGGDVVICQDGRNKLLEYYEAEVQRNNPPSFAEADTYPEILEILLLRLGKQSPVQEAKAREALVAFKADQRSLRGVDLIGLKDFNISLPVECAVKKVIIAREKQFPEDKTYFIQKDLWEKLSEESKAGLVFQMLLFNTDLPEFNEKRDAAPYRLLHSELAGRSFYRVGNK